MMEPGLQITATFAQPSSTHWFQVQTEILPRNAFNSAAEQKKRDTAKDHCIQQ